MAKYNVSKNEAKKLGIERVLVGGGGGSSGGGSSSSSLKKLNKQYEGLQSDYLKTMQPTTEELGYEKQLSDLITSRELGIANVKQEPMPQQFVTGQSKGITEMTALKSMPLETQLAQLQKKRQISSDTLKTSLDFLREQISGEKADESARYEREMMENELAEKARQFDITESRRGSSGKSDADKITGDFEKEARSLADQVLKGKMNRETAKSRLRALFPDFDENVIYDLVPDFYEVEE